VTSGLRLVWIILRGLEFGEWGGWQFIVLRMVELGWGDEIGTGDPVASNIQ
jgi:hypothetical protein